MIYSIIGLIFEVLNILLLLRVLISWLAPMSRNDFTDLVYSLTEPMLRPFRTLIPVGSMRIDFSPILAYFVLRIIRYIIFMIL